MTDFSVTIGDIAEPFRAGNNVDVPCNVDNGSAETGTADLTLDILDSTGSVYASAVDTFTWDSGGLDDRNVTLTWADADTGDFFARITVEESGSTADQNASGFTVGPIVTSVTTDEATVEWSPHPDADVQRVHRGTSEGFTVGSDTIVDSVANDAGVYSDDGLLDGTEYHYKIEAVGMDDDTETSLEVQDGAFTITRLPQVTGVDASLVEGDGQIDIVVTWDPVLDNGEYTVETDGYADSSGSSFATVPFDSEPTATDSDVNPGEDFDITVAPQTEDALNTDKAGHASIATPPAIHIESATQVYVTWYLTAGYFSEEPDTLEVLRRRTTDTGKWEPNLVLQTPVDRDTPVLHEDTEVVPRTEYEYRLRWTFPSREPATTPWSAPRKTDDAGPPRNAPPPLGWHVELDHPNGLTLEPELTGDSQFQPVLNDQPSASLTVAPGSRAASEDFEGQPVRAWRDSDRQAVDELSSVAVSDRGDVLNAVGATQLERTIRRNVTEDTASSVARTIIEEDTPYRADVDEYDGDPRENITAVDAEGLFEFQQLFGASPFESTSPLHIAPEGGIAAHKSCLIIEAEDADDPGFSIASGDEYSGGEAAYGFGFFGGSGTYKIDVPYDIEDPEIWVKFKVESGDHLGVGFSVDGVATGDGVGEAGFDPGHHQETVPLDGTLSAGEHTIDIEWGHNNDNTEPTYVDCFAIYDKSFSYDFTSDPAVDGVLDTPQEYADELVAETDTAVQFQQAVSGALEVETDDPNGVAKIELSNDDGHTWMEASSATEMSGEFDKPGPHLRARFTMQRFDDDASETPAKGDGFQAIRSVRISADFDPSPLVLNRDLEGDAGDVLTQLANDTGAVWEAWHDGKETVVSWTWPGQRSSNASPSVSDYNVQKDLGQVLKCTVVGATSAVFGEEVTASIGEAVPLGEENVRRASVSVHDAEDDSRYSAETDYELDAEAGTITFLEAGDVSDGDALVVDYDFEIRGTYEHEDWDGDPRKSTVEHITSAYTSRAAEQAAAVIVEDASEPRWSADVQIPWDELQDVRLSESLDLDELPGPPQTVHKSTATPSGIALRLGSRPEAEETVRRIQSTLDSAVKSIGSGSGTSATGDSDGATESFVDGAVESHRASGVHDEPQPAEVHDNDRHEHDYLRADQASSKEILNLKASSEPDTPANEEVVLWNSGAEVRAKFDDGSEVVITKK